MGSEGRDAQGVVWRWDLDKTYLRTDFGSVGGLLRAAVEAARAKKTIPGARALLAALSEGKDDRVVVVSGSPAVMRRRLERTLALHGVRFDKLVLKDVWGPMRRGRLRTMKQQVPYKMRAHLETRLKLHAERRAGREICFGDDAEFDALIYCLYTDVCARRVSAERLASILERSGAYPDEVDRALATLSVLPIEDPVERIFIHLEEGTPPSHFSAYCGRVWPTFNGLQIACSLFDTAEASAETVRRVADELVSVHRFSATALAGTCEDAARRGLLSAERAAFIVRELLPSTRASLVGFMPAFGAEVARRLERSRLPRPIARPVARPLPYERLLADERGFGKARKLAREAVADLPSLSQFLEAEED